MVNGVMNRVTPGATGGACPCPGPRSIPPTTPHHTHTHTHACARARPKQTNNNKTKTKQTKNQPPSPLFPNTKATRKKKKHPPSHQQTTVPRSKVSPPYSLRIWFWRLSSSGVSSIAAGTYTRCSSSAVDNASLIAAVRNCVSRREHREVIDQKPRQRQDQSTPWPPRAPVPSASSFLCSSRADSDSSALACRGARGRTAVAW